MRHPISQEHTVTRPFIASLLAHIDGQASREVALQAYREAEEKHGVRIYDDHDARVAPGAFKPHMPTSDARVRTWTRSREPFARAPALRSDPMASRQTTSQQQAQGPSRRPSEGTCPGAR